MDEFLARQLLLIYDYTFPSQEWCNLKYAFIKIPLFQKKNQ